MELPLVLAGPILRRAEPRAVAVWVALSRPGTVSLLLWEGIRKSGSSAAPIARSPSVQALRVGERLYIALAVAERALPDVPLQPGVNYAYDLVIEQAVDPQRRTLATEGLLGTFDGVARAPEETWFSEAPLGYTPGFLPSFALPPAQLTQLRLVYGSCRLLANMYFDAMPWIDTLIEDAFTGQSRADGATLGTAAAERPHQLFLGGDQIYADDVSPLHLALCNRLGHQLVSGTPAAPKLEQLQAAGELVDSTSPRPSAKFPESLLLGRLAKPKSATTIDVSRSNFPATLACFPAGGRFDLTQLDGQFTSMDGASHLLSFGEFAGMYLGVFSDRCWEGLGQVDVVATAQAPGGIGADRLPLCSQSMLDTKAATWFDAGRWKAWNDLRPKLKKNPQTGVEELRPSDPRSLASCFAMFMLARLARSDLPAGFEGFRAMVGDPDYLAQMNPQLHAELSRDDVDAMRDLQRKHISVFTTFMKQLQARVMRGLVRRFGITRLADCDCVFNPEDPGNGLVGPVLLHGRTAILGEAHKRKDDFDEGRPDPWLTHLNRLLDGANWPEFVRDCLQTAEERPWGVPLREAFVAPAQTDPERKQDQALADEMADAVLEPPLLNQLVAGWTKEPDPGQHDDIVEAEYTDLSRTMLARCVADFATEHIWKAYRSLHGHLEDLNRYRLGQPKVRRALANVPTYMIFDDHDVTDDWNLNPVWCERVLKADGGGKAPLGRQIVRNALASYALFQDWGNDLSRYGPGSTGQQVLTQIQRLFAAQAATWPEPAAAAELDRLFGLDKLPQPVDASRPHGRHDAVDAPMKWHYTVEGPQFTVAVLDNRTRRGFVSRFGPPGNVALSMLGDQIPTAPLPAGKEVLIVVAPLQVLAPSVFDEIVAPGAYRAFDIGSGSAAKVRSGRGGARMPGLNPDAIESWALDAITLEALLARLAPHRKVLLLSGDVHNSAATQMSYWRKGEAQPSRIVQFTSSGIKNVMPSYLAMVDHSLAFAQELVRANISEDPSDDAHVIGGDRMGWLDGADGAFVFPAGKALQDVPLVVRKRIAQRPAHLPTFGWPSDPTRPDTEPGARTSISPARRPDFSWTLRPVFDLRPDGARPLMARPDGFVGAPPTPAELAAGSDSAFDAYARIAQRHFHQLDRLGNSRFILFRSNLARVVFNKRPEGQREVLEAVHQVMTALSDPLDPRLQARVPNTHLLKPEVAMEQRAELTPPLGTVRPEDRPLRGPLGEALANRLRALVS